MNQADQSVNQQINSNQMYNEANKRINESTQSTSNHFNHFPDLMNFLCTMKRLLNWILSFKKYNRNFKYLYSTLSNRSRSQIKAALQLKKKTDAALKKKLQKPRVILRNTSKCSKHRSICSTSIRKCNKMASKCNGFS